MAHATNYQNLKDVAENGIHDYGIEVASKLAALTFRPVNESFSTPPALQTPSPPHRSSINDQLNTFTSLKKPNFRIEIITPDDSERVLVFLKRKFFIDEPLNIAVGLIHGENDRCLEFEEFSTENLDESLSIMAVGNDEDIKGVVLGRAVFRKNNENPEEDPVESCGHPRFKKILKFLYTMDKLSNIFGHYPELNSYYDLKIVSVDSNCRGEGIASILIKKAVELAKLANLDFVKVDCSSEISGKIVEKMGFQTNFTLPYSEYRDNGAVVFQTEEPHTHFRVKSFRL